MILGLTAYAFLKRKSSTHSPLDIAIIQINTTKKQNLKVKFRCLDPGVVRTRALSILPGFNLKKSICENTGTRLALHARFWAVRHLPIEFRYNACFLTVFFLLCIGLTRILRWKMNLALDCISEKSSSNFWELVWNKISTLKYFQ